MERNKAVLNSQKQHKVCQCIYTNAKNRDDIAKLTA